MIVVTDTSVILNLCFVGLEGLLPAIFGEVLAPPGVAEEFHRLSTSDPRFLGLAFPSFIKIVASGQTVQELIENRKLHAGEIEALSLALNLNADAVLMDESAGRSAARKVGLHSIGIFGILIQAKRMGSIPVIKPVIEKLELKAGFWIGPALKRQILGIVDE